MTSGRSWSARLWGSNPPLARPIQTVSLTAVAAGSALAIGTILRLRELLVNRSLSQDEAQLALNIIDRPFARLFGQLDYNQAAPPGFLAVQKLVTEALGYSEYSLRLFPFVVGTLALVLILFLARAVVSPLAIPVAVGLFALSEPLISYTTSDKQYAVDVLMTVAVLLVGFRLDDRPHEASRLVLFAGVGAIAVWLSYSSIFVLAGVSTAFVVSSLAKKQWDRTIRVVIASIAWLASFAILAFTSLDEVEGIRRSLSSTPGAFAGSGYTDSEALGNEIRTSLGAFRYIGSIPHFLEYRNDDAGEVIALIVVAFCVVGVLSISASRPERALALIAPLGFMLIAWVFGQYPLLGRTQLFLVPMYVLLLSEGIARTIYATRCLNRRAVAVAVSAIIGFALAFSALKRTVQAPEFHEMKPVLEYIAQKQHPGDAVYVHYTAQPQLRYYIECGCGGPRFEAARKAGLWPLRRGRGGASQWAPAMMSVPPRLLVGQERDRDPKSLKARVEGLRGRTRVWVLLPELEVSTRATLVRELDRVGTRRATFAVGDVQAFESAVVVYLYDLTGTETS